MIQLFKECPKIKISRKIQDQTGDFGMEAGLFDFTI
jgi:hypothetical protein